VCFFHLLSIFVKKKFIHWLNIKLCLLHLFSIFVKNSLYSCLYRVALDKHLNEFDIILSLCVYIYGPLRCTFIGLQPKLYTISPNSLVSRSILHACNKKYKQHWLQLELLSWRRMTWEGPSVRIGHTTYTCQVTQYIYQFNIFVTLYSIFDNLTVEIWMPKVFWASLFNIT